MRNFLTNNREELVSRCKSKVALRPRRAATEHQLANGIPLFLEQLIRTLAAEEDDKPAESVRISGPSGGDSLALSEMGVTATAHGKELLKLGYTVDQVVHDYGDLCQAITDLAFERDAPFAIGEFR
ncbi:sensor histidine kinase, partial [Variovorax sp. ZT5P30]